MANIEILTNDNYKILSYLYDNRDEDNLVKITQGEVCDKLGYSRPTINAIFKTLKDGGFVVHDTSRVGHYYLTDEAVKAVKAVRKIG